MLDNMENVAGSVKTVKKQLDMWLAIVWCGLKIWCLGEDLNLHGVAPTST